MSDALVRDLFFLLVLVFTKERLSPNSLPHRLYSVRSSRRLGSSYGVPRNPKRRNTGKTRPVSLFGLFFKYPRSVFIGLSRQIFFSPLPPATLGIPSLSVVRHGRANGYRLLSKRHVQCFVAMVLSAFTSCLLVS